jgi:isoleucyl-tRNA synthetase
MAFAKVETQGMDFPAQERAVLEFWQHTQAFERLRRQNHGKPKWSFLDGPITANNPMGVHHAWGRTYKDAYQRFQAMTGHELRYQNGFDCQGLWVEVEVEKELGLKSKRDIEDLVSGNRFDSIDQFVQLCKQRVDKFARRQTEQSIRLGYWMDWDKGGDWDLPPDRRHSYFTMSEENNYTIWSFLKKCHERGLVYRAYDAMPWCPRCAVGLSQMEMHEGYQMVAHRAVFVRFPLRGRPGENLLVWTTTPWTLTSNVAAAVNPQLTYLKVKHRDQVYYLARGAFTAHRLEEQFKRKEWVPGVPKLKTLEQVFKEKGGYEIVGELPGAEMVGWAYDGPFDELPAQDHPMGYPEEVADTSMAAEWTTDQSAQQAHRIIPWKDVGETEGTGIVHIAPGCGKEDFLLGKENQLPPVAPLDEEGRFLPGFGALEGKSAVDAATTDWILNNLREKGVLLEVEKYPHSYPHCWRCKTELLFRLVDEWFINMSWRDEIKQVARQATWLPETINGLARELDWLGNMGDWMISKKRFWGLALPIWVCAQCNAFEVIGGRAELQERAVAGWEQFAGHTPHRPWIDLVKVRCKQCGGQASRIPDVGNPWLDAGIVPYSTMGYNTDRAYWEQWFPADFVTEAFPGQFRNWFYAMLAMSTMMTQRTPFKVLLGHAMVRDERGEEMHKAKGNSIPFEEAAERMSADVMRWLYCRQNPANNLNFGYGPAEEIRSRFMLKLWNTYAFFCDNARQEQGGFDVSAAPVPLAERPDMDRWILSDLQKLIQTARRAFQEYNVQAFCLEAERFVDDKLSNWYVRRNKRRFWKSEEGRDKLAAFQTLYTVLTTLAKLFAPVMPFLTEAMYQNLVAQGREDLSVHLCAYPEADAGLVDEQLSADMDALFSLRELGSAARNTVKIKVRQPLAEMRVQPAGERERRAVERFAELLCEELNLKKVTLNDPARGQLLTVAVQPNMKTLGPKFGPRLQEVVAALRAADAAAVAARVQEGQPVELACPGGPVTLEPADVLVRFSAPEGWAGAADRGTQVAIDTRLTEELKREGQAREVIRQVNDLRKKANLEIEDRIILRLDTDSPELRQAIESLHGYIGGETLVAEWAVRSLDGQAARATVKVDGQPLTIELRKVN